MSRSRTGLADADIDDILREGRRFVHALRDSRILVTGATGWFGTWLLDGLVALNYAYALDLSIVAVSRNPSAFRRRHPALGSEDAITWLEADVCHPPLDVAGPVTHVIHAATDTSARAACEAPDRLFDTIVEGTRNVLALAARHSDTKVLIVGSGAVYGRQPVGMSALVESYPGAPDPLDVGSAYAEAKRAAETLAAVHHAVHGVQVSIARCFAFVGPHMPFDGHFAIGNFIRDVVAGTPIRVSGDGRPRRSYLYMSDLVVWLLAILYEGRPVRAYNVGSADAVTIAELARRCAAHAGRDGVVIDPQGLPGRDYVPDVTRAASELGVRVTVPLDAAIARTAAWATLKNEGAR